MSVVVEDLNTNFNINDKAKNILTYYVKGSPEALEKISNKESLPLTLHDDINKYAKVNKYNFVYRNN